MKKWMVGELVIFLLSLFFCFFQMYQISSRYVFGLSILGSGILLVLLSLFYHSILKMYHLQKKHILFAYGIFFLLSLVQFLAITHCSFGVCELGSFGMILLSSIFLSLFVHHEYEHYDWVFSLLLLLFVQVIAIKYFTFFCSLMYVVLTLPIFLTTFFDDLAIYRKKNYIFMLLSGLCYGALVYVSPLSFLSFLFFFFLVSRKRGIKSAIKLSVSSVIGFITSFAFLSFCRFDFVPTSLFDGNDCLWIAISIFFLLLSFVGTIWALFHRERKMGYLTRGFLFCIFFGFILFSWTPIWIVLAFSVPIFLLLSITIYQSIPAIYHKKIRTQNIRRKLDTDKKISVVIPNYNYEHFLHERISSILNQTLPIYELIILDDCSRDNSVSVIEEEVDRIREAYPDLLVKFLPNKKNSGNVFKQWGKCFSVIQGDYLWICEADDSAHPKFLESVMPAFDKDERVVLSYCESLSMDQDDNLLMPNLREWIDLYGTGKWDDSYILDGNKEIESTLCINNTIANVSSVVFKVVKDIPYLEYLKEAEAFKLAGDWHFYTKVLEHGSIAYFPKSYNYHRFHNNNVTLTTKDDLQYQEVCRIQDRLLMTHEISNDVYDLMMGYRTTLQLRFGLGKEEVRLLDLPFEDILKKSKVKDEVLLSVIIPVYNTEPYLRKCLDSILYRLPIKTEIIIVNDGSPDESQKIIEEYEAKYSSVVFGYVKENGGLSSAKNFGLEKAKGRYVIYLDSDDYVSVNMYMTMLKKALETDADIVYSDIFEIFEDGSKMFFSMRNYEREDEFFQMVDTSLMAASWNKMCKRSLFKDLEYPEGLNNEDIAVSPILFEKAKKIVHVDSPFYYYYQRSGSIQNSGFSEKRFVIFDSAKLCFEKLEEMHSSHITEFKGSIYTHQLLALLMFVICKLSHSERIKYMTLFCERMNEFEDFSLNPYVLEYVKAYHLPKMIGYIKNMEIKKLELYLMIKMR